MGKTIELPKANLLDGMRNNHKPIYGVCVI